MDWNHGLHWTVLTFLNDPSLRDTVIKCFLWSVLASSYFVCHKIYKRHGYEKWDPANALNFASFISPECINARFLEGVISLCKDTVKIEGILTFSFSIYFIFSRVGSDDSFKFLFSF